MAIVQSLIPSLWLDDKAEEAAKFYVSIFEKDSRIVETTKYPDAGSEIHGHKAGTVMTVELQLLGQRFTLLNGGPHFKFNEAVSFQVMCETQAEIDRYWEKLNEGGDPKAQQCGWLKDKFGLSWQIVPANINDLYTKQGPEKAARVMKVMLGMKKLVIADLEKA